MQGTGNENKNLILALLCGMVIMIAWHFFYELPRQKEYAAARTEQQERLAAQPPTGSQDEMRSTH